MESLKDYALRTYSVIQSTPTLANFEVVLLISNYFTSPDASAATIKGRDDDKALVDNNLLASTATKWTLKWNFINSSR